MISLENLHSKYREVVDELVEVELSFNHSYKGKSISSFEELYSSCKFTAIRLDTFDLNVLL